MSEASRVPETIKAAAARARRMLTSRPAKAIFIVMALAIAIPALLYKFPALAGADEAYIVLSGSMVPTFSPGDVIFVDRVDGRSLAAGDVVTLRLPGGRDVLVTHRVIEVQHGPDGSPRYVTKGDANEETDPGVATPSMVVGTYEFRIPYWGLLSNVLKTKAGYLFLIIVPGLTIIGVEMLRLYRELDRWDRARQARKSMVTFEVIEEVKA